MLHDDSRGVDEALNEIVCVQDECIGLTVRTPVNPAVIGFTVASMLLTRNNFHFQHAFQIAGKYYLRIDPLGEGAKWRRSFGQEIYSPMLLAFTLQVRSTWHSELLLCYSRLNC